MFYNNSKRTLLIMGIHSWCRLVLVRVVSQPSVVYFFIILLSTVISGGDMVRVGEKQGNYNQNNDNDDEIKCPKLLDDQLLQPNFDLRQYTSKPWYSHQQAETKFQGLEYFYCIRADSQYVKETLMGYTVRIVNQGQNVNGVRNKEGGAGICAYQPLPDDEPALLAVALCDLPVVYAVPYWVVAFEEEDHTRSLSGYALVSGGPLEPNENGTACRVVDDGGLWIMSRSPIRNERLITHVREIAAAKKLDLSVLHDVQQGQGCNYYNYYYK